MRTDDGLVIASLTEADVAGGMALVAEAGWNQVEADWRYVLRVGQGFGLRDGDGRLVASSVALSYPPTIGWIGMILVRGSHRRRGYATRLLRNAIDVLAARGLTPALDATPAGREVYRRLGFADGEAIERWRGNGRGGEPTVRDQSDLRLAARLDAEAFGADRAELLTNLASRPDAPILALPEGALFGRRGRTAMQLGPLLTASLDAALALCERAIRTLRGPLLIDVPARETALRSLLKAEGFAVERSFTRMFLGHPSAIGRGMRAMAGPELG